MMAFYGVDDGDDNLGVLALNTTSVFCLVSAQKNKA